MLKRFSRWTIVIAPIFGVIVGHIMLTYSSQLYNKKINSSWKTSFKIDKEEESVLEKAARTKIGVYALPNKEITYFIASNDENGNLLQSANNYKISGIAPTSKNWSITMYNENFFLVANPIVKYHFNGTSLNIKEGEPYTFTISKKRTSGNWLPSPKQGRFVLCYRIYLPPLSDLESQLFNLPRITKL
jgi:hypothetical protein